MTEAAAFVIEPRVDPWGYWHGGDGSFPTPTALWPWTRPYPAIDGVLECVWEPGHLGRAPDIGVHSRLRDFVCNETAFRLLERVVQSDLHVVARASCQGTPLVVVQVSSVLDVADTARSVCAEEQPDIIRFPILTADAEDSVRHRLFRLPNKGMSLTVLAGAAVVDTLQRHGVEGLAYLPLAP